MSDVASGNRIATRMDPVLARRLAWIAGVAALLAITASADGPRTALLAGLAGGAVLATRTRFAPFAAAAVVVLTAALMLTGRGAGG